MTDPGTVPPPSPPRLFPVWAVGLGGLIGGPLGGGALLGLNFRRLGDPRASVNAFAGGAIATVLLGWLLFGGPMAVTYWIPKALIPAICGPLAAYLAVRWQGEAIQRAGAGQATAGETAAWIAGALVASLGVAALFSLGQPQFGFYGHRHAFGPRDAYQVCYAGGVSADARDSLERYLMRSGYFANGNRRTAQLVKSGRTYTLSLEIMQADWNKPELAGFLNLIRGDLEEFVLKGRVRLVMVEQGRYRVYRREVRSGSQ